MSGAEINLGIAFIAGLASFLSPCVFSLVPAYIGYLGGRSAASGLREDESNRWLTLSHGLAFVLGFSVIFIVLGIPFSLVGGMLKSTTDILSKIGGIVVIVFGIHMTGLIRIPFLEYDLRPQSTPDRRMGYLSSFLMGIFFSAGWSPCVGPILGAILTIAMNTGSVVHGVYLLTAYSAGLAIPFLFAATEVGLVTKVIRRYGKIMHYVEVGMGVILIVVGILLFLGRFSTLGSLTSFFGAIDEVAVGRYLLIGLIVLIFLGLFPAAIASQKGRSFVDWWLFGVGLFPVALVAALLIKPNPFDESENDQVDELPGTSENVR
jgi:cytochrome c-type biogenesis protein